jgi:hypothetical protein
MAAHGQPLRYDEEDEADGGRSTTDNDEGEEEDEDGADGEEEAEADVVGETVVRESASMLLGSAGPDRRRYLASSSGKSGVLDLVEVLSYHLLPW